jgi:hypothetical protein
MIKPAMLIPKQKPTKVVVQKKQLQNDYIDVAPKRLYMVENMMFDQTKH